jgi:pimeloyl-ACP methyl ester carboxylesterase
MQQLCLSMFRDADVSFMQWGLRAILEWNPAPLEGIPIRQIHGTRDRLIPARKVSADELIAGGGHLINLTHAEQVNHFLRGVVDGVVERTPNQQG